jgi:hypothetical protein
VIKLKHSVLILYIDVSLCRIIDEIQEEYISYLCSIITSVTINVFTSATKWTFGQVEFNKYIRNFEKVIWKIYELKNWSTRFPLSPINEHQAHSGSKKKK